MLKGMKKLKSNLWTKKLKVTAKMISTILSCKILLSDQIHLKYNHFDRTGGVTTRFTSLHFQVTFAWYHQTFLKGGNFMVQVRKYNMCFFCARNKLRYACVWMHMTWTIYILYLHPIMLFRIEKEKPKANRFYCLLNLLSIFVSLLDDYLWVVTVFCGILSSCLFFVQKIGPSRFSYTNISSKTKIEFLLSCYCLHTVFFSKNTIKGIFTSCIPITM